MKTWRKDGTPMSNEPEPATVRCDLCGGEFPESQAVVMTIRPASDHAREHEIEHARCGRCSDLWLRYLKSCIHACPDAWGPRG